MLSPYPLYISYCIPIYDAMCSLYAKSYTRPEQQQEESKKPRREKKWCLPFVFFSINAIFDTIFNKRLSCNIHTESRFQLLVRRSVKKNGETIIKSSTWNRRKKMIWFVRQCRLWLDALDSLLFIEIAKGNSFEEVVFMGLVLIDMR